MPPQQGNGLLDVLDAAFSLGAHVRKSRRKAAGAPDGYFGNV
jgi:hypothetical protein